MITPVGPKLDGYTGVLNRLIKTVSTNPYDVLTSDRIELYEGPFFHVESKVTNALMMCLKLIAKSKTK